MEIFTPEQAAHFLQIDVATLQRMAERGEVPGRRLGNEWRFSRNHLADWVAAGTRGASAPGAGTGSRSVPSPAAAASAAAPSDGAGSDTLSVAQAAGLLGVSAMTLRKWADAGRVAVTRTKGGHRVFRRADLLAARDSGAATRRRGGRPKSARGTATTGASNGKPAARAGAKQSNAASRTGTRKPGRGATKRRRAAGGADPADMLTIGDAANYLGVSAITLRKWSNDDKVKSERTAAGHRRYRRSELDRVKASRR